MIDKSSSIINGIEIEFKRSPHNKLQKAVLEEFSTRFAKGAILLYVGDTADRYLYINKPKIEELGIEVYKLKKSCENSISGLIFVTAFQSMRKYKEKIMEIAWDTEVWVAEVPDHMIHLNGDRFLGPRS